MFETVQWDETYCYCLIVLFLGFFIFWSEWEKKTRGNQGLASEIKREQVDLEVTNGCVKRLCEQQFLQGEWGQLSMSSMPNVQLTTQQLSVSQDRSGHS